MGLGKPLDTRLGVVGLRVNRLKFMGKTMIKLFWNIVLFPMLPLIWKAEADYKSGTVCCGFSQSSSGCIARARWMRKKMAGR